MRTVGPIPSHILLVGTAPSGILDEVDASAWRRFSHLPQLYGLVPIDPAGFARTGEEMLLLCHRPIEVARCLAERNPL